MGRPMEWTPIEEDVLTELYLTQRLSAQKIAKITGAKVYQKRHKDAKNNYSLCLGSTKKSLLILHELYDGATTFLDRKNNLYLLKKAQLQSSLSEMVGV